MTGVRERAAQYVGNLWVPQFADICDLTHTGAKDISVLEFRFIDT